MNSLIRDISKVRLSTLVLVLCLSFTSCSDSFLQAIPETDLSDASAFDTPARILSQVNGIYGSAKNGNFLGGRYLIYNDIRGEEFVNRTTNSVTGYSVYQGNPDPADTYVAGFWNQGYLTINRINLFLEGIAANSGKIDATLAAQYSAEVKFIRALTYFSLVQIFAKPYVLDNGASPGLPLRLIGETSGANSQLKRSTVAQVYDQILKDLNEAEGALPDDYASALLRTTRAHKNTAIALKTRVLLAKKDYAGVLTEGNKIVSASAPFKSPNRVAHELQADVVSVFRTPYTSVESIFSFPMAETNAPGTQNQLGYYFNFGNLEYVLNNSGAGILANTNWSLVDDRRAKLTAQYTTLGRHPLKFSGVSPFLDYVPNIRYAEVLLNIAEAEAESGSLVRARALLEAIRNRSDATYQFGTLDKAGLIEAILLERRIELLAEGFRTNDVLRRGQPINSFGAGGLIQPTSDNYIYGIPLTEQQTNPGL